MPSTLFYQVIAILLFLFLFNPFNPQVHKSSIQSFLISTKSPFKASRYIFFKSFSFFPDQIGQLCHFYKLHQFYNPIFYHGYFTLLCAYRYNNLATVSIYSINFPFFFSSFLASVSFNADSLVQFLLFFSSNQLIIQLTMEQKIKMQFYFIY